MSMPLVSQPPPMAVNQQVYNTHSSHGSIGPVIAVLAVIIILGIIAGMIGRLCSGRRIMGYGQYDFEGWVEAKCASCIDGRISGGPPPSNSNGGSGDSVPVVIQMETPQETKQTEEELTHNHPHVTAVDS